MLDRIRQIADEAVDELKRATSKEALEQYRIKYLGAKGVVKDLLSGLKDVPPNERPQFGKMANELREQIQKLFEEKKSAVGAAAPVRGPTIDITEPAAAPQLGRQHVISQTIDELIEVFGRMGFDVATGPEVEDDYHNFVALNIPQAHPARDPLDNFYLDDQHLLRSQTSTIQIRVMEKTAPPVRVVAMGRVYRPDAHDATHYSMFHQVEGLYVDRNVTMADLKTTLIQFVHAMFGPGADVRLRPSYFPFTEPSAELEVRINLQGQWRWLEIGGCGMVDPAVFKAVGYDPEEWTGFAFGMGIERLAMRKYGIEDIRWLFENDVRFLRQF